LRKGGNEWTDFFPQLKKKARKKRKLLPEGE
jgi:hypothetical protein